MDEIKDKYIVLDIGGVVFKTSKQTLQNIPHSRLAKIDEKSEYFISEDGVYFFDRDPNCFREILNAYRYGELHIPKDVCPKLFRRELDFWEIPIQMLSPCCWKPFYKTDDDLDVITAILNRIHRSMCHQEESSNIYMTAGSQNGIDNTCSDQGDQKAKRISVMVTHPTVEDTAQQKSCSRREKLWLFLEEPRSSFLAKVWCYIYLGVVILNVAVILGWEEPGTRVDPYLDTPDDGTSHGNISEHLRHLTFTDPHPSVFVIDILCMVFFIAEATVHFVVCPRKSHYPRNFYNIIKFVLCLTMVVTLILDLNKQNITNAGAKVLALVLRNLSIVRLLLIFRLHKLYQGLDIMLLAIKQSFKELLLLVFAISILVFIYGAIMYSSEINTDVFPNVWLSMWWAIITMTTVGYGDRVPETPLGYIIGTLCAVNGLIVLAMPVAAVAGHFSSLYSRHNDLLKHQRAIVKQTVESSSTQRTKNVGIEMTVLEKSPKTQDSPEADKL